MLIKILEGQRNILIRKKLPTIIKDSIDPFSTLFLLKQIEEIFSTFVTKLNPVFPGSDGGPFGFNMLMFPKSISSHGHLLCKSDRIRLGLEIAFHYKEPIR